jgi:hypothetical protein
MENTAMFATVDDETHAWLMRDYERIQLVVSRTRAVGSVVKTIG